MALNADLWLKKVVARPPAKADPLKVFTYCQRLSRVRLVKETDMAKESGAVTKKPATRQTAAGDESDRKPAPAPSPRAASSDPEQPCDSRPAARYPGALTDEEWALVADLFEHDGPGKPPKYPRRQLLDACCYAVRTGCSWRMLPKDLPPWQDVYAHFRRWAARNLFEAMHERLRAMWRTREGRPTPPTPPANAPPSAKPSVQRTRKAVDASGPTKGRKRP